MIVYERYTWAAKKWRMSSRMLKSAPSVVLGSTRSSTYPARGKSWLGSSWWDGENKYASDLFSPAALLEAILNILLNQPRRYHAPA